MTSGDPYIDPSSGILRNIPNYKLQQALSDFEAQKSFKRLIELRAAPIAGNFDFAHLCAIHRHIFQDVYDWAGKPRTTNTVKLDAEGRSGFVDHRQLNVEAAALFDNLKASDHLRGTTRQQFADRGAELLAAINTLHPFREGNGRTQKEFMRQLAAHAGHELDLSVISEERMISASIAAQRDDLNPIAIFSRTPPIAKNANGCTRPSAISSTTSSTGRPVSLARPRKERPTPALLLLTVPRT